jgi:hypothetical protein
MSSKPLESKLQLAIPTLLVTGGLLICGCVGLRPSYHSESIETDPTLASEFRTGTPDGQRTGLDPRAREIEASLGVK